MTTEQELRAEIERLLKENAELQAERDEALEKMCRARNIPGPVETARLVRELQDQPIVGFEEVLAQLKNDSRNVESDSPIIVTKYAM